MQTTISNTHLGAEEGTYRQARDRSTVSLGWLTLPNATAPQVVEAAALAGFGAVSIRIACRAGEQRGHSGHSLGLIQEVRAALVANGIRLLHMGGIWLDGSQPIAAFERAMADGAELGARMCVGIATPGCQDLRSDYRQLCQLAARYGMRVAIEFGAYLGVRSLAEARAVIAACGESNLGILIDALHLFRSGGTVADVLATAPGDILLAQICDAGARSPDLCDLQLEARGNRLDPGQGELPIAALVKALPAHAALELEAPCLAYRNQDPAERAQLGAIAVDRFLAGLHGAPASR